jgi:hypothetical protein
VRFPGAADIPDLAAVRIVPRDALTHFDDPDELSRNLGDDD